MQLGHLSDDERIILYFVTVSVLLKKPQTIVKVLQLCDQRRIFCDEGLADLYKIEAWYYLKNRK
jgi:hypothetical protein